MGNVTPSSCLKIVLKDLKAPVTASTIDESPDADPKLETTFDTTTAAPANFATLPTALVA
jgi:hypothetical protein